MKILLRLALLSMLAPLGGCATINAHLASLFHGERAARLDVRPTMSRMAEIAPPSPVDRLYDNAKRAIGRRDYADAMDLLQLAQAKSPNDPRILNAMGVIYDKLGRLDLSGRYYQLALAAEPGSPIVQANLRYSVVIGERYAALQLAESAPARAIPDAAPSPEPAAPVSAQPARNASGALVLRASAPQPVSLYAGRPLIIVDASGRPETQASVRTYLASAGWSVSSQTATAATRAPSEIRFAPQHRQLAEALARTLPFKVALADCAGRCGGLELVLGADAPRRLRDHFEERKS